MLSPTYFFVKITFFLLYLQIFRPFKRLRYAIWAGLIFTTMAYAAFTITWLALATPRAGETWQTHFTSPAQLQAAVLAYPVPAVGLAIDLYILVLPLIGVYKLQLSLRRKFGVFLVFATAIVLVFSIP